MVLTNAVILRSQSRGIHNHILLPYIRDCPSLEPQVLVFIHLGSGCPSYSFSHWGFLPVSTKSKLSFDRRSVQSVLVSRHHLGPATNFSLPFMEIISRQSRFFSMGRPLWRGDGYVIYSYKCYWASPAQSLSGSSPVEFETISCCLLSTSGGRSVGIVRLRTKGHGVCLFLSYSHLKLGSLSVASYGSQGYGRSIPSRLHTRVCLHTPLVLLGWIQQKSPFPIALLPLHEVAIGAHRIENTVPSCSSIGYAEWCDVFHPIVTVYYATA
jgi:hypothetical protein